MQSVCKQYLMYATEVDRKSQAVSRCGQIINTRRMLIIYIPHTTSVTYRQRYDIYLCVWLPARSIQGVPHITTQVL